MVLRPDTDPQSAAPRSGAPKGELEKYGVWVKAEPQDVVEEPEPASSADFDFDIPGDADHPQESFLSEDEEKMLNSFELEGEEGELEAASAGFEDKTLPDIEDIPSLEEPVGLGGEEGEPKLGFDAGTIDISLDDLEATKKTPPLTKGRGAVKGIESVEDFGPSAAAKLRPESGIQADMDMEDVSADFLGPSTDNATPKELDDVTAEFLGAEEASPQQARKTKSEFEPIDIDLQFDDTIPSAASAGPEGGFEEVTEFDDFLRSGHDAGSPIDAAAPKAPVPARPAKPSRAPEAAAPSGPRFDDLAAVEKELEADSYKPAATGRPRAASSASDLSTEILLKIADELASIRGELVSLKTQLSDIVRESVPQAPMPPPTLEENEEPAPSGGFFDEEEDETIALTGDELDNILNTADFTEEVVEAQAPADELGIESQIGLALAGGEPEGGAAIAKSAQAPILDEKLLPESGEYFAEPAAESAIEEVTLSEEESLAEEVEELPEVGSIGQIADEGVRPMTEAPEDTSYLEEEAQGGTKASIGNIPLVEPDLSAFNLGSEELLIEPLAEIEEELPLAEVAEVEALPESMELTSAALTAETLEAAEAELEPLEIIPEMEESAYGEINLHEEKLGAETPVEEFEELVPIEEEPGEVAAKPSRLVPIHPDEIPTSLDDSLFVGAKPRSAEKPKAAVGAQPKAVPSAPRQAPAKATPVSGDPDRLKSEIKSVLSYLDKLLDSLPEEKIEEFAKSEYFDTYKRLFEELGLV